MYGGWRLETSVKFEGILFTNIYVNDLNIVRYFIIDNGSVNRIEKIEAEGKGDANFNVVCIRICVSTLYIQFVVSLRVDRLSKFNFNLTSDIRQFNGDNLKLILSCRYNLFLLLIYHALNFFFILMHLSFQGFGQCGQNNSVEKT